MVRGRADVPGVGWSRRAEPFGNLTWEAVKVFLFFGSRTQRQTKAGDILEGRSPRRLDAPR